MRVERFRASSMREALNKIKIKLGDDAVVLHSRSVKDGIEVIAARDSEQTKTGNTWLDEVIQRDKDLRAERKVNEFVPKTINDKETNSDAVTYTRNGQKVSAEPEPKVNEDANLSTKWDTLMDDAKEKRPDRAISHLTIEQLEQATRKASEFSEVLHKEMKNEEEQRKLWLEHEKQLDSMKQELVELKESLLRQELRELQQRAAALKQLKAEQKARQVKVKKPISDKQLINKINSTLAEKGFSKERAKFLCEQIQTGIESLDLKLTNNAHIQIIKNILSNEVKKMISVYRNPAGSNKQKIVALFGPAEAGKTATAIKLALQASIINEKKVALILISDSENTTLQHLNMLTSAAKLPLAIISEPDELVKTLQVHSDKDLIVIDYALAVATPENTEKLTRFFAGSENIEKNLVLAANSEPEQLENLQKLYKKLDYNSIIMTKLDTITKLANIIELLHQFSKPLSYVCTGKTIPDDIEIANATKLTYMILKG